MSENLGNLRYLPASDSDPEILKRVSGCGFDVDITTGNDTTPFEPHHAKMCLRGFSTR